jgi:HK97 family phage portal protein
MSVWRRMTKAFRVTYPAQPHFLSYLNPINAEAFREVGDGTGSSVVMAPLQWLCRTFPEAPLVVDKRNGDEWDVQVKHDLAMLIARPNPFWSGEQLWWATIMSLVTDGNGYLIKLTDRALKPTELWWAPPWTMEPKWPLDGKEFISHYEYNPGLPGPTRLETTDVIHFRWGVNPANIRKGQSPLYSVIREVFSDDEAAVFASSLLRNMGVPGLVISPDGDAVAPDDGDLEATEKKIFEKFRGTRRGRPLVAGAATRVQQFGFTPQQMDVRTLRRLPEERVSAVLGVPAIVAGLGAGLDRSTFANFAEAREMAYESGIIPLQRTIAADLGNQLLGDFVGDDTSDWRCRFDLTEVRVLQEDEAKIVERKLNELKAGAITLATYLRETGREAGPEHEVYLRPFSVVEVPENPAEREEPETLTDLNEEVQQQPLALVRGRKTTKATQQQQRLARRLREREIALAGSYTGELVTWFAELGDRAADVYMGLPKMKADEDAAMANRIMGELGDLSLKTQNERQYQKVASDTIETINSNSDLGVNLEDPAMRKIIATGGKRAGLIDIRKSTRDAIFRALLEGRELGEGPVAVARRIRELVPAGRFTNAGPFYRSQLIARTETKYAQNISSMRAYRESPVVTGLLAFDSQGSGETDEECLARDGVTFTFDEADVELDLEHPNGTLSFAPVTS